VIKTIPTGANISYKTLSKPIIEFLQKEGAAIYLSERNDIMLTDKKVSGSAMHIFKNRALAHCTLLIDCNINNLSFSLKSNPERFTDKSIASVRSKVMNLSEVYNNFSVAYIIEQFAKFVIAEYRTSTIFSLSESDLTQIKVFESEKYATQEWIYGYSPKYSYKNSFEYNGNTIKYNLEIEKGIIKNVAIESINQLTSTIELELNKLIGRSHNISEFAWNSETLNKTDFYRRLVTSLF
jgi:lipoate-protein ligase A